MFHTSFSNYCEPYELIFANPESVINKKQYYESFRCTNIINQTINPTTPLHIVWGHLDTNDSFVFDTINAV